MKYRLFLVFFILMIIFTKSFAQESIIPSDLFDMSIEELMNIKVTTAGKKEEKISEIPASVIVISRDEIERYGYISLRDILSHIPGYYAMSNLGIDIYGVRGFAKGKGTNFVIMINGVKITDQRILKFYEIPVTAIDRIEVIRGPMSVIYGNNAFFGAINIITNQVTADWDNLLSMSYGTFNTKQAFGRFTNNYGDLKTVLNVSVFDSDGMDEPLRKMMTRPERMDEPLFGGEDGKGLALPAYARRTDGFLERKQLYLNFSADFNKFEFVASYVEADNGWYYYYPSLEEGSIFQNRNTTISLEYKDSLSDKISLNGKLRYSRTHAYHNYNHLFEEFYGWETYNISELEGELNVFISPAPNLNMTLGLQYENMLEYLNDADVPVANIMNFRGYYTGMEDHGIIYSGFIQADYLPTENLKLLAGVRLEQIMPYNLQFFRYQGWEPPSEDYAKIISDKREKGDIEVMPRGALIYRINPDHIIKLLYGKAIKRPDYETIAEDMRDIKADQKPAGYSKPEYIYTHELNYISSISENLGLNISLFWNRLENLLIERNAIVDDILRAWWTNAGEMETKGIEATLRIKPIPNMECELSGIYQNTRDKTVDIDASFSPDFLGYLKFSYQYDDNYTISLTGNYIDKIKPFFDYTPIFDENGHPTGEYIGRTAEDVEAYYILDANFRWIPSFIPGFYLNFNCSNLVDTEIYYPTFSINNAWADKGTLGKDRTFLATVGWKF